MRILFYKRIAAIVFLVIPTISTQANLIEFDELKDDSLILHRSLAKHEILKESEDKSKYNSIGNLQASVIDKLSNIASDSVRNFSQTGITSWYARQFQDKKNMHALTAAHNTLPLNCLIKVTNKQNGKSIIVKVNYRSALPNNRILDLSYGAAKQLGIDNKMTKINIERIDD